MAPRDLWQELCSYENLELAFKKARKHKTQKSYVIHFEKNLTKKLQNLQRELIFQTYNHLPLKIFTIRDPKMRKISKSDFRDRVIHHALCNLIEPIFAKSFINDSFANQQGKGTQAAIKRFDIFKRKVSKNNTQKCFILKADIKHYFDTVDLNILLDLIKKRIKDKKLIWLINKILSNHRTVTPSKGMPLGNLTSQFFANVYLNELDHFVKHKLKIKYYIRYVDDFVILHSKKEQLLTWRNEIEYFLKENLQLFLHPDKSKIILLGNTINFLGLRVFYFHKLLKKSNLRKMCTKLTAFKKSFQEGKIQYDSIYDFIEGWSAHAKNANTFKYRKKTIQDFENCFCNEISTKEINRYQH